MNDPSYAEKVRTFVADYEEFAKSISSSSNPTQDSTSDLEQSVKDVKVTDKITEEDLIKGFLDIGGPHVLNPDHHNRPTKQPQTQTQNARPSS